MWLGHAFGLRQFLPGSAFQDLALLISIFTSVLLTTVLLQQWLTGNTKWAEPDQSKKQVSPALVMLAAPFVIFLFAYVAIGHTAPHLVTKMIGEREIIAFNAFRDSGTARYLCDYSIGLEGVDAHTTFFELCITKGTWDGLPEGSFVAEFSVQKSAMGLAFNRVRVRDSGLTEDFSMMNVWSF